MTRLKYLVFSISFLVLNSTDFIDNKEIYVADCISLKKSKNVNDYCDNYALKDTFYSQFVSKQYLKSFPDVTVNVSYWAINRNNGKSDNPFTMNKAKESIKLLNESFKTMNVSFRLKKFDTINNSKYYWNSLSKFYSLARTNPVHEDTLAVNIYVPYKFTNFRDGLRGAQVNSRSIAVNSSEYNTGILIHEMGHVFDLKHTHRAFKANNCERVTRNPEDENYNANCAGDFVVDTGAMRELNNNTRYISEDCKYEGNLMDCDSVPYKLGDDEIKNFMSYTLQHCRDRFTTGQSVRVREYIKNDPSGIVKSYLAR